jgi:hypothetical protein
MFRSVCPMCQEPSSFDDTQAGREVDCSRCRSSFVATPSRSGADEKPYRSKQSDGSSYARFSLLLALVALPTGLCGIGVVFALGGLLVGYIGLQSRLRTLAIVGMVLNLVVIILSIGLIALFLLMESTVARDVPPAADGTQAPFMNAKK